MRFFIVWCDEKGSGFCEADVGGLNLDSCDVRCVFETWAHDHPRNPGIHRCGNQ